MGTPPLLRRRRLRGRLGLDVGGMVFWGTKKCRSMKVARIYTVDVWGSPRWILRSGKFLLLGGNVLGSGGPAARSMWRRGCLGVPGRIV